MNINERVFWNCQKYGRSYVIKGGIIRKFNLLLGVIIPCFYPVPVALFINRFIKDIKIGRENNKLCLL